MATRSGKRTKSRKRAKKSSQVLQDQQHQLDEEIFSPEFLEKRQRTLDHIRGQELECRRLAKVFTKMADSHRKFYEAVESVQEEELSKIAADLFSPENDPCSDVLGSVPDPLKPSNTIDFSVEQNNNYTNKKTYGFYSDDDFEMGIGEADAPWEPDEEPDEEEYSSHLDEQLQKEDIVSSSSIQEQEIRIDIVSSNREDTESHIDQLDHSHSEDAQVKPANSIAGDEENNSESHQEQIGEPPFEPKFESRYFRMRPDKREKWTLNQRQWLTREFRAHFERRTSIDQVTKKEVSAELEGIIVGKPEINIYQCVRSYLTGRTACTNPDVIVAIEKWVRKEVDSNGEIDESHFDF
ncbi:4394_t:CDS:2 [Ambispora gerdemannii]|uniref:4394_t:CDS:1 n=1 Tax=Ambispora gerdemannii TaxID=144530 RepID=A0A9N9DG80_9GLOM|nr:4394_t:CDS:2 [Ambispora gerdemannii]